MSRKPKGYDHNTPTPRTHPGGHFDDDTFYARLADETTLKNWAERTFGKERSRALAGEGFGYRRERDILRQLIRTGLIRRKRSGPIDQASDLWEQKGLNKDDG